MFRIVSGSHMRIVRFTAALMGIWTIAFGRPGDNSLAVSSPTAPATAATLNSVQIVASQTAAFGNETSVMPDAVEVPAATTATDRGTANAYDLRTVAGGPIVAQLIEFKPSKTNTGPSTVTFNEGHPAPIITRSGAVLAGGEISGQTWIQFTGSAWQIVGTGATAERVRTAAEIAVNEMPANFRFAPGDPRRWGAVGGPSGSIPTTDDSSPWALDVNTGYVSLPPGWAFKIVKGTTHKGQLTLVGAGKTSQLYSDGALVSVTNGTGSVVDNLWAGNITAPWIITRNPANWAQNIASTLQQSSTVLGYEPTINDGDIWPHLTPEQKGQQIGPTFTFSGAASGIEISRVYGQFVLLNVMDAVNSSVSYCNIRGGKGVWGVINFDNATHKIQVGVGNRAVGNVVTYGSFSGIAAYNNDGFIAVANYSARNGESGIKAGIGPNALPSVRSTIVGNQTRENYYDGLDMTTAFPVTDAVAAYHQIAGNTSYGNGGDGANLDGRYSSVVGNTFSSNYRFGLWATGSYSNYSDNTFNSNNQARSSNNAELLGGTVHNLINGNKIYMAAGENCYAIYATNAHLISNNYAEGGHFNFGSHPGTYVNNVEAPSATK
jgi:hypothetical protein